MMRPESIDLRWIFRGYAVLAIIGGIVLIARGPVWMAVDPATSALIRLFASILAGAGCCALGLAAIDDPPSRKPALIWFAIAHFVVFAALLWQSETVWGEGKLSDLVGRILFGVAFAMVYIAFTADIDPNASPLTTLFRKSSEPKADLRSQYEQQIRAAARQEERNRLARDLHDSIKQQIFVIQTSAATAQERFAGDSEGARQALDRVRDSAREAMTEMEAMLEQMAAAPLENSGLVAALKKQCEAFGFRTGARVEFKLGDLPESNALPPGAHEALLRIGQEALANVGRHARAKHVVVSLGSVGKSVRLAVEDDGAGFDAANATRGQGLANIRARAEEFGGAFGLTSRPGGGTTVAASVAFETYEPAAAYLRKAVGTGLLLLVCVAFAIFQRGPGMIGWAVIAAVWTARYIVAYRRALTRSA
jgi:signal transduction histidine kinase